MHGQNLAAPLRPRSYGRVNGRGLWTLYRRGVSRHFKDRWSSLGGPCASAVLFLAVFSLAAGDRVRMASGLDVAQFIAPGIIVFALSHTAFESAATSLIYDKYGGMIGDVLSAPLTPLELVLGHAAAAASNGLITGLAVLALSLVFTDFDWHQGTAVLGFGLLAALLFALFGTLTGLWGERWEHYSAVESFIMLPLMFLSGAFFTLDGLPVPAQLAVSLNPLYYAVNGLRYGLTGYGESAILTGAAVLLATAVGLLLLAWRLFAIGYKVKP